MSQIVLKIKKVIESKYLLEKDIVRLSNEVQSLEDSIGKQEKKMVDYKRQVKGYEKSLTLSKNQIHDVKYKRIVK